jgi:3-methyl-2-oxobutanoate hydroxymethyltransferase
MLQRTKPTSPIVMLTCYDYPSARILDEAGVDVLLVGDSVGTNVLGYDSVNAVTMNDMRHHVGAVSRGTAHAFVLADMPTRSYTTPREAVHNARLLCAAGADGVKLEGGLEMVETVKALVKEGIAVCGHIGYTPQSIQTARVQGKEAAAAIALVQAAEALSQAGLFMIVLELITEQLARIITQRIAIPTIGIGAGSFCDGQVQVLNDITGLSIMHYRHAKAYESFRERLSQVGRDYGAEVRQRLFPTSQNVASMAEQELAALEKWNSTQESNG